MPEISPEVLAEVEKQQAAIIEIKRGVFKGPWLETMYDNRSECYHANMRELNRVQMLKQGKNEWGQTKEQQDAMAARRMEHEKIKDRARIAEQITENTKSDGQLVREMKGKKNA